MKKYTKGFTLIELLVVIAIIGILSSVVLASLNQARAKGSDSAIKANLAGMKSQAGLIYDNDGGFDNVCTNSIVLNAIHAAETAAGISTTTTNTVLGTGGSADTATCHASPNYWAIEVPLRSNNAQYFCVDHSGKGVITTGSTLPANDLDCE